MRTKLLLFCVGLLSGCQWITTPETQVSMLSSAKTSSVTALSSSAGLSVVGSSSSVLALSSSEEEPFTGVPYSSSAVVYEYVWNKEKRIVNPAQKEYTLGFLDTLRAHRVLPEVWEATWKWRPTQWMNNNPLKIRSDSLDWLGLCSKWSDDFYLRYVKTQIVFYPAKTILSLDSTVLGHYWWSYQIDAEVYQYDCVLEDGDSLFVEYRSGMAGNYRKVELRRPNHILRYMLYGDSTSVR